MFNNTQRFSWLPSLATATVIGFMALLSGCGGGGGAGSTSPAPMLVVPDAATAYAYSSDATTLTIRNGRKPFHVASSNTAIIAFNSATMVNGTVPDEQIVLGAPDGTYGQVKNVDVDTPVTLTIFDADNQQVKVVVTVKPSALNNSLTITDPLAQGTQGRASVTATSITGAPLAGHKVRFRVMDQGAKYGFVCNPALGDCVVIETDAAGHNITVETTTDRNGNAYAVTMADVGASTQSATISATDMTTGQVLRKQFVITGTALAVLPASATWSIGVGNGDSVFVANGADGIAGTADDESMGGCAGAPANGDIGATTGFYLYGGTPPYTITSTAFTMAGVSNSAAGTFANTTTVAASGSQFYVRAMCTASGTANIVVTDSVGAVLSTVTFIVNFMW